MKEAILPEECGGFRKNVGDGCMTPYEGNEEVVNTNYDTFVQADTELLNERRCDSDNKATGMPPGQKTMETENEVDSIINTTEQKALTSFTIDAILNKTDDKKDGKKYNHLFTSDNNSIKIKQCDDLKSQMKSTQILKDNTRISNHQNENEVLSNNYYSDSNVFFDNVPTGHFLWMSPTPFYPLYPLSFHNMSPTTGLTSLYNVSPTTSITGLPCFPSLPAHMAPPLGYFMLDQNENRPKAWDLK